MSETTDQTTTAAAAARTPEQIQAELEAVRAEMSVTVDQLVQSLSPATQVRRVTDNVRGRAQQFAERARIIVSEARDGDRDAIEQVGLAVLGITAVVGLIAWRTARRHRG